MDILYVKVDIFAVGYKFTKKGFTNIFYTQINFYPGLLGFLTNILIYGYFLVIFRYFDPVEIPCLTLAKFWR